MKFHSSFGFFHQSLMWSFQITFTILITVSTDFFLITYIVHWSHQLSSTVISAN